MKKFLIIITILILLIIGIDWSRNFGKYTGVFQNKNSFNSYSQMDDENACLNYECDSYYQGTKHHNHRQNKVTSSHHTNHHHRYHH